MEPCALAVVARLEERALEEVVRRELAGVHQDGACHVRDNASEEGGDALFARHLDDTADGVRVAEALCRGLEHVRGHPHEEDVRPVARHAAHCSGYTCTQAHLPCRELFLPGGQRLRGTLLESIVHAESAAVW